MGTCSFAHMELSIPILNTGIHYLVSILVFNRTHGIANIDIQHSYHSTLKLFHLLCFHRSRVHVPIKSFHCQNCSDLFYLLFTGIANSKICDMYMCNCDLLGEVSCKCVTKPSRVFPLPLPC